MNRALRRHHYQRLKTKRQQYWGKGPVMYGTPARCSCWMCGNPRKYWKSITKQERLANLNAREFDINIKPENGSLGYY